jgi:murein DD-endopeptidase MepM/ murein hydrolase activator NlpD
LGDWNNKSRNTLQKIFGKHVTRGPQRITLIVIPEETGRPTRIQMSRAVFVSLLCFGVMTFAASMALSIRYFQLRDGLQELGQLRRDFDSLKNEASALYSQLIDVQSNLNQVDAFSDQVRKATKFEDDGKNPKRATPLSPKTPTLDPSLEPSRAPSLRRGSGATQPLGFLDRLKALPEPVSASLPLGTTSQDGGIGPLSPEDYKALLQSKDKPQNLRLAARVKPDSLAFGELFTEIESVRELSAAQIDDLAELLNEVNEYREKIDQTPTFVPVDGRLTSTFGLRESPFSQGFAMHRGLDIAAPLGSPIRAAAAGIVIKVGRAPDYGKFVQIKHGREVVTVYAHAQQIFVRTGDRVHKGQKIASVGMTGRTTGPHLHFEVRIGNRRVNPAKYISFNR